MATTKKSARDTQQELQLMALQQLAIIGGAMTNDEDIEFDGKKFVFPEQFRGDLPGLSTFVNRYVQGQEEEVLVDMTFDYRPHDLAYATYVCLRDHFGYAQSKARQGMFGPEPPQELVIPIGYLHGKLEKATVPWGDMVLPGLRGSTLTITHTNHKEKGALGRLVARCRRADKPVVDGFFRVVEDYIERNSIYRSHAVYGNMEFFDTEVIDPDRFVYTEAVWAQAETNILSPMKHAKILAEHGMSPKRVVLLEGPFGTGKSGLARTAAKVAVSQGWTAITARPSVDDPFAVLQTARLYQPALVFIEDVDTFSESQDPGYVSRLLDQFDGFGNKDVNMLLVLTTNHPDRIHKGMLRPGRLDAVIHIGDMDRPGVERLANIMIGKNLDPETDFDKFFDATHHFTPAYVAEAIERAFRYTIAREGKPGLINDTDLANACESLRAQHALQEAAADSHEKLPPLDQQLRAMIEDVSGVDIDTVIAGAIKAIEARVNGGALIDQKTGRVSHQIALQ